MIELFKQIAEVQPKLDGYGWCDKSKTEALVSMVVAYRPSLVVEVGVFGGGSFIPMAMAAKWLGSGMVVGIDPWDKDIAVQAQTTNKDREWWAAIDLEAVYNNFSQRVHELGLDNVTKIFRNRSNNVEPPGTISILHIDGSHNDQAVTDVVRFAPRVEAGGICVTDDSAWVGGGPARAEQRLLQIGFVKRYNLGSGAVFVRAR